MPRLSQLGTVFNVFSGEREHLTTIEQAKLIPNDYGSKAQPTRKSCLVTIIHIYRHIKCSFATHDFTALPLYVNDAKTELESARVADYNIRGMSSEDSTATTSAPIRRAESKFLRSQCNEILKRLFPDPGKVGDCSPTDIIMLLTIFFLNRKACLSRAAQLLPNTTCYATHKLITHPPYHYYHDQSAFIDMRRYLALLAEGLRSFREEVNALPHDVRNEWYDSINNLYDISDRARRTCPKEYQIELWDVMFFLKHCQYLIVSIKDSYSNGEILVEFAGHVVRGALQGYSGQYVDAMESLNAFMRRKRSRENWHQTYLDLEQLCFNALAHIEIDNGTMTSVDWDGLEHQTTILLKDTLDDELMNTPGIFSGISRGLRNMSGFLGRSLMSSGQYEENDHYFKYGLLDLMYHLSFRLKNRKACFEELVGAIHIVLKRSDTSSTSFLRRKAIDLYHQINDLGKMDNLEYGKSDEREAIERWMTEHPAEVEIQENSKLSALANMF